MSLGFHQAYCWPCQKRRAWRMRRISWRRAVTPSARYWRTSSRRALTSSGLASSSSSLFGPRPSDAESGLAFAAPPKFPSAGATEPLVPVKPPVPSMLSTVGYRSIHPLVTIRFHIPRGVRFAPHLHLVPGAFAQAGHRDRLCRLLRKIHWRKSRGTEQRIGERAILSAQTCYLALKQADIPGIQ